MRQEVGEHVQITPGEAERYYEQHKQEYAQPESERLSEILISASADDPAKVAAAKAKADDIEARLHAGGDFAQLARSFSDGTTAAQGGDLGQYKRGQLPKVLEDQTFDLKTGQYTDPILTRQGYIILKVVQHTPGGPKPYKEVQAGRGRGVLHEPDGAGDSRLSDEDARGCVHRHQGGLCGRGREPQRDQADLQRVCAAGAEEEGQGGTDRFRESTRTFRQKSAAAAPAPEQAAPTPQKKAKGKKGEAGTEKPGKKEKIRYGQAPRETLPTASTNSATENAGALPETASNTEQPANPLEPTAPTQKTRFSARARTQKKTKTSGAQGGALTPAPPDAAEVADRQTQSAPLGLSGQTPTNKKKKAAATTAEKTRLSQEKKKQGESAPKPTPQPTPIPPVPGAPAPAQQPQAPQPQTQQ